PADMLPWQYEGVAVLVSDPNKAIFATTPVSPSNHSSVHRTADLKLLADGTLEGDVSVEFTGHSAAAQKEDYDDLAATEQETALKEGLQARIGSNAEITNIKFANVTDPSAPMTYKYHVRVPAYAQRTGRRLLFQPGY